MVARVCETPYVIAIRISAIQEANRRENTGKLPQYWRRRSSSGKLGSIYPRTREKLARCGRARRWSPPAARRRRAGRRFTLSHHDGSNSIQDIERDGDDPDRRDGDGIAAAGLPWVVSTGEQRRRGGDGVVVQRGGTGCRLLFALPAPARAGGFVGELTCGYFVTGSNRAPGI